MTDYERKGTIRIGGKHRSLWVGRRSSYTLGGLHWWTYGVWFYGKGPFLPGQRREFTLEFHGKGRPGETMFEGTHFLHETTDEELNAALDELGLLDEEDDDATA